MGEGRFDVAIIGGGINGLGVARDLAKRGLRVYLAEKRDFGMGATGNSSGMIHGGIRYLLSDTAVSRRACRDSGFIQNIAKNLVFRIPFLMPVYDQRSFAKLYLSLSEVFFEAYDDYQPLKNGRRHGRLSAAEALAIEPGIAANGLLGAVTTDDWGIDANRLCVLNALDAKAHGAVIENYSEVTSLTRDGDRVTGFTVRQTATGVSKNISADLVLNCTGAWNKTLAPRLGLDVPVRPGKGIHLVFSARISDYAIITSAIDGRQVFLMPHQNETWFGTTDDDYFGDPDHIVIGSDEIEYLYVAAERLFPKIRDYRCFSTMVGLRPTIAEWGPNEDDLSRDHRIVDHRADGADGVLSIIGGKLASFREMAEELADRVLVALDRPAVACRTHLDCLPGHERLVASEPLVDEFGIDGVAARRLVRRHGGTARSILVTGQQEASLATACACEPVLECEVRHVLRHEWIAQPSDLVRRCRVANGPCLGLRCAARVGQIYAQEKGGDATMAIAAARSLAAAARRKATPVSNAQLALELDRVDRALGA